MLPKTTAAPLPQCPHDHDQQCYRIPVDTVLPVQQARKHDQASMQVEQKPNTFRARVCVLCDRFIIGCETVHKISSKQLVSQGSRISVRSYEDHHQVVLKEDLVSQYHINGLEGLLLSPRARSYSSKDGEKMYDACSQCATAWANKKCDSPPKHAIANGFAIGHVPDHIISNQEDISEEMCALLSPVRPFAYIFAYSAGAHKSIRGHYSFFEVDLTHTGAVLNHFLTTGANPLVYTILCGRMTPKQKEIVKNRARLDTSKMMKLLEWFIIESGHNGFRDVTPPKDCPQPTLIIDEETNNNTDQEQNPSVEEKFAGASFHFTSTHEPQEDTGVHETNQKFVKAMLERTMPTLLVSGRNYANLTELALENIAPLQFPFGQGGPTVKRRNRISPLECYRHYCRLSLPQFFRGDFLLILNNMYNRLRSYTTASLTCRTSTFGSTLAEKISTLRMEDFYSAVLRKESHQKVSGTAGDYLNAVEASCKPVGYSALNARIHRRQHFAMDNLFGGHSIFLTTTPCDECTFRVQIFANAGKEQTLPNLRDYDDNRHMKDCVTSFDLRKRIRRLYPGACSLVYQHLMQIITECLIGWDTKTQTGRMGVFGIPLAYTRTDEEQGRKTLHSHWQIWIKDFNKCRAALFDRESSIQKSAREAMVSYIDKVICASYGTDFVVTHRCDRTPADKNIPQLMSQVLQEVEDKNILRKAQHQDHCFDIKGRVLSCIKCGSAFSTTECVNMGVNHLRQQQQELSQGQEHLETCSGDTGDLSLPQSRMKKEWLDHAVIRFPYDFDETGRPTEALAEQAIATELDGSKPICHKWLHNYSLRRDLLHYAFDEHACTHRGPCFKKNASECRANLPEMANKNTVIFDNKEIDAIKKILHKNDDNHPKSTEDIFFYHLDGKVEKKSQYTILPRRKNGSQFLNQHNIPVSGFLGCNTNITMGDPSHTYYTTLYKTKDTQAEDKAAYHRIIASLGKRLWRKHQMQLVQQQQEEEEDENTTSSRNQQKQEQCHIEGLGRVITGLNALLSRDVVSSTMAHLLISQGGERFIYSHGFSYLLLHNLENILEGKGTIGFRFRTNWNKDKKERISWPDCSAYDYIYRPIELECMCFFEYTMWYQKVYKTFKQINNGNIAGNLSYMFIEGHPGRHYCYLKERKVPVIPIISTSSSKVDISLLQVLNENPGLNTKMLRERYAKDALMLFLPFRQKNDLLANGNHWQKFVDVGGTAATAQSPTSPPSHNENKKSSSFLDEIDVQLRRSGLDKVKIPPLQNILASNIHDQDQKTFWPKGRIILQNIQTRITAENKMKRPDRKITLFTETPKGTGQRTNQDVDNYTDFDMDISNLCTDAETYENYNAAVAELRPNANTDLRSHKGLMDRGNISQKHVIGTCIEENETLIVSGQAEKKSTKEKASESESSSSESKNGQPANSGFFIKYKDLLTFIQGSLLGGEYCDSDSDSEGSSGSGVTTTDNSFSIENQDWDQRSQQKVPRLHEIAAKYNLDQKQRISYQIVCCTFLLQLVNEGNAYDTKLGEMLGMTIGPLPENTQQAKDSLTKELKARGAKDQLIMFLTGGAGCGKSTTMEAAQLFAHSFCAAIAVAFNDYTFYFTATTGSAAALYGGTTIHAAAHLNKRRLTDEMRAVWREDVRILIIDEISFFTATEIERLDRQLKKLTGRQDVVYGGISIVFAGDFHQLKPICTEDEVLYSDSPPAAMWENAINCAIFLDNSHRFKNDPLFGEILDRMRNGEDTLQDRLEINKRVVGSKNLLALPENAPDACYACSTNKERNGVTAAVFKEHIKNTHPDVAEVREPPGHTLMIEASTFTNGKTNHSQQNRKRKRGKKQPISTAVHDTIVSKLGDDDIRASGFGSNGAKIEPALRVYPGSHHMCMTNDDLDKGRGNGTLCKCVAVKLKKNGLERRWKNWDGKKVWTVSISDVQWVEFEHYPAPAPNCQKARTFKLTPQKFAATIKFPLTKELTVTLGNANVTQIPVNSNIATTGHKLQGMSKDIIIVKSWNYKCANWVYVVLSRVRTRKGLYLLQPLDLERSFNVPQKLIRFEQRLKEQKEKPIIDTLVLMEDKGWISPGTRTKVIPEP